MPCAVCAGLAVVVFEVEVEVVVSVSVAVAPQQCFDFFPLPQGQGAFREGVSVDGFVIMAFLPIYRKYVLTQFKFRAASQPAPLAQSKSTFLLT